MLSWNDRAVPALSWAAALYGGILGVAVLLAPGLALERFGVTPPNHAGDVQFPPRCGSSSPSRSCAWRASRRRDAC
jgi:hypothetical protein